MNGRRAGCLAAIVTVAASGWYFFVYLTRWEWNRALTAGLIFLAAEIALFGSLALDRIARLQASRPGAAPAHRTRREPDPQVLARIRGSAPLGDHFAWLRPEQANVFVPVLLGAGVAVSGIAWLVERLARATVGRHMERGLALRLGSLAPPPGGLIRGDDDPLTLFTPGGRSGAG